MKSRAKDEQAVGRAPQGARGLKCFKVARIAKYSRSRPARGAWVEIELPDEVIDAMLVAPRKGRVG